MGVPLGSRHYHQPAGSCISSGPTRPDTGSNSSRKAHPTRLFGRRGGGGGGGGGGGEKKKKYSVSAQLRIAQPPRHMNFHRRRDVAVPRCRADLGLRAAQRGVCRGRSRRVHFVCEPDHPDREKVYGVTTDVLDLELPGNGWVYAFPRVDQWEAIPFDRAQHGNETLSAYASIYAGTLVKLHPSGISYSANNGLSPSDFEKYDIRSGAAVRLYGFTYHGDSLRGNLWMYRHGHPDHRAQRRCLHVVQRPEPGHALRRLDRVAVGHLPRRSRPRCDASSWSGRADTTGPRRRNCNPPPTTSSPRGARSRCRRMSRRTSRGRQATCRRAGWCRTRRGRGCTCSCVGLRMRRAFQHGIGGLREHGYPVARSSSRPSAAPARP